MAERIKEQKKKEPFNHVLEVQNGFIDARDIFKRINAENLKENKDVKKLPR